MAALRRKLFATVWALDISVYARNMSAYALSVKP
jgi:hypothetical protein